MTASQPPLRLPVVHAPESARHDVETGVWCGVTEPADELPIRAEIIRGACEAAGATLHLAVPHGLEPLRRIHTPRFLEVMATAYERWVADGHLTDPGAPYVTAYFFPPVGGRFGGDPGRPAATIRAEIGRYAMDTMTGIGSGTWEGAVAAADAALTATDLVLAGAPSAYAICRPPGHHAGPSFFGGSCYLNNAAAAAAHLRAGGCERVAVIDIDAHHGNGTQAIFWDDAAVLYASLHVDPGAGWFPHTVGYADERDASGTNVNLPLAPGTGDDDWLAALHELCRETLRFGADALVVSLGVDAATEDPNGPLEVTSDGFATAGRMLGRIEVPTVLVHEGGYVPETLGRHTLALLRGLEEMA
ncbi:MAG: histone deacetylase family protein [Acidimicrobiia bacterium]